MKRLLLLLLLAGVARPVGGGAQEPAGEPPPSPGEVAELFATGEDRGRALAGLARFATSLPTDRATLWLQVAAAAERSGSAYAARIVDAVRHWEESGGTGDPDPLEALAREAPSGSRSAVVWLAALLLGDEHPRRAAELRRLILADHPDAPEVPEATVAEAGWLLGPGTDPDRAHALLEALVVERPDHPVAPRARALLLRPEGR